MEIFYPYRIETPNLIDIKFGAGDYVRETTRHAKFGANPSTGDSGQIGEIITLFTFYLYIYTLCLKTNYTLFIFAITFLFVNQFSQFLAKM